MKRVERNHKNLLEERVYKSFGRRIKATPYDVYLHLLSLSKKYGSPLDRAFVYMSVGARFKLTSSSIKKILWILKRFGLITYFGRKLWLVLPNQTLQKSLTDFHFGEKNAND